MRALRVRVEQAVRPVWASQRRKSAMRDELLSHVTAVYEEEVARTGDTQTAVEAALARFGDAAELTPALQETVPRWERVFWWRIPGLGRLDATAGLAFARCKQRETVEHRAARNVGLVMLLATAAIALPILVLCLVRTLQNDHYPASESLPDSGS